MSIKIKNADQIEKLYAAGQIVRDMPGTEVEPARPAAPHLAAFPQVPAESASRPRGRLALDPAWVGLEESAAPRELGEDPGSAHLARRVLPGRVWHGSGHRRAPL